MSTTRRESGIASMMAGLKKPQTAPRRRRTEPAPPAPAPRGPGRPPGKKSNPDYRQHSVWLRRTTHRAAMAHLRAQNPDTADFSELVEALVTAWNAAQPK